MKDVPAMALTTKSGSVSKTTLAVDLMGSDTEPLSLLEAVKSSMLALPDSVCFKVIGTKPVQEAVQAINSPRIEGVLASEVIFPDDLPLEAIRRKKESSLLIGIKELQENKADALVSACQTGALYAASSMMLPLLSNVKRPALLAEMPTKKGPVAIIDVGGNVSSKAQNLVQYAWMGAAYQRIRLQKQKPKVALLNIGLESQKGTGEQRQAFQILQNNESSLFEFVGNIEAREVFQGSIDVLVTEGFSGNVLLKASEGIATLIFEYLLESGREINNALKILQRHFDYTNYPGALVAGVEKLVLKCHGNATSKTLEKALIAATDLVEAGFLDTLKHEWSNINDASD